MTRRLLFLCLLLLPLTAHATTINRMRTVVVDTKYSEDNTASVSGTCINYYPHYVSGSGTAQIVYSSGTLPQGVILWRRTIPNGYSAGFRNDHPTLVATGIIRFKCKD